MFINKVNYVQVVERERERANQRFRDFKETPIIFVICIIFSLLPHFPASAEIVPWKKAFYLVGRGTMGGKMSPMSLFEDPGMNFDFNVCTNIHQYLEGHKTNNMEKMWDEFFFGLFDWQGYYFYNNSGQTTGWDYRNRGVLPSNFFFVFFRNAQGDWYENHHVNSVKGGQ